MNYYLVKTLTCHLRCCKSLNVLLRIQAIILYFVRRREERVKVIGNQHVVIKPRIKSVSLVMKTDINAVDSLWSVERG